MLIGKHLLKIGYVVCCTQRYTDVVLVAKFRVEGNPKIFDLICQISGCTKEFY